RQEPARLKDILQGPE
ncbi:hypothetical protein A2U01_0087482, partial [Trifolium medium]|nr:hypothetical protein [Trifolium medium]